MSCSDNARLTASSVPPIWWTWVARIIGPSAPGSAESSAAAQPSPKIEEPTVLARGSSAVARVRMLLMLSAPTTRQSRPGCCCSIPAAIRISGTALAQATPVTWYLSVVGSIS